MDAFFASVEQRDNPELRGKPIAVGGAGKRGVVAAASYEARRFGVRSAMPSITAARLCPDLVFVKPRFDVYSRVSKEIREIFFEYTDLVEPLSLDEAYLDVTEAKQGPNSATLIAKEIREKIFQKVGLTASAGVSFNKFLAKIASDVNKPNGMKVIQPAEAIPFLDNLKIEKFHGIGKVTAKKMHSLGIFNGADLKKLSELELVQQFGKVGRFYFRIVRAQDEREVQPNRIRKSIGAERTFNEDLTSLDEMYEKISPIAGKVFEYMKKTDNFGRTISLKVKTADFQVISRSKTFASEIRSQEKIKEIVNNLIAENFEELKSVRLLGVTVSNLSKELGHDGMQLELEFFDS